MFDRLARVINKVPWIVVGVAIVFAALSGIFVAPVQKCRKAGGSRAPTSRPSQALARLEQATGMRADGGIIALVKTPQGTNSQEALSEVSKVAWVIGSGPDGGDVFTY